MNTKVKNVSGIKVITNVKAGGIATNRNRRGLALSVRSGLKAGSGIIERNHSRAAL